MPNSTRMCLVCEVNALGEGDEEACRACRERYPYPLLKAQTNNWTFFAGLDTGEIVKFTACLIQGEWVNLMEPEWVSEKGPNDDYALFIMTRGVWVQVKRIVWCMDQGS